MKRSFTAISIFFLAALVVLTVATTAFASATTCDPQLSESAATPFWGSYGDYSENVLTVDESVQNTSSCATCTLRIAQVTATEGVTVETPLPIDLNNVPQAASTTIRIKYRVPPGVTSFHSRARVICAPAPRPVNTGQFSIKPSVAWANEGCPVAPPEMAGLPLPEDQRYGWRSFTAALKDIDGKPISGMPVKWGLSVPYAFRIVSSDTATDELGHAAVIVSPPEYFVCIIPYYSSAGTQVTASIADGKTAEATFVYSRCLPGGSTPPWANPDPVTPL